MMSDPLGLCGQPSGGFVHDSVEGVREAADAWDGTNVNEDRQWEASMRRAYARCVGIVKTQIAAGKATVDDIKKRCEHLRANANDAAQALGKLRAHEMNEIGDTIQSINTVLISFVAGGSWTGAIGGGAAGEVVQTWYASSNATFRDYAYAALKGGALGGAGKALQAGAAKVMAKILRPIVVGRTMTRVMAAAERYNARTFNSPITNSIRALDGRPGLRTAVLKLENYLWLEFNHFVGRRAINIGANPRVPDLGEFFPMEPRFLERSRMPTEFVLWP